MGLGAERGYSESRGAGAARKRTRRAVCRWAGAAPAALGRLPRRSAYNRVLAGAPQPPARPFALHAPRRRLADRAAFAVGRPSLQPGQNLRAVLGDGNRMLELRRERAVGGAHRPAIALIQFGLVTAGVDHRLDGEGEARL